MRDGEGEGEEEEEGDKVGVGEIEGEGEGEEEWVLKNNKLYTNVSLQKSQVNLNCPWLYIRIIIIISAFHFRLRISMIN